MNINKTNELKKKFFLIELPVELSFLLSLLDVDGSMLFLDKYEIFHFIVEFLS